MTIDHDTLRLVEVDHKDFDDFAALRKSVMKPNILNQGLEWDEDAEHERHLKLFQTEGLFKIVAGEDASTLERIGYIGITDASHEDIKLSRFCIDEKYQGGGIGAHTLDEIIFAIPAFKDKHFVLEVLVDSPARKLYESLGFELVRERDHLAFYRRKAQEISS